jgi:hypothetical protein
MGMLRLANPTVSDIDLLQAWYAIGCIVIITRFFVRMRTVGIRHFQGDDYIAIIVSTAISILLRDEANEE